MGTPTGAPTDPSFMGYLIQGTQTSERFCGPLQTFTTFDSIAACCPRATTVLCNYYTTCTNQCQASGFSCMSQTIYATYPTVSPHTHFVCAGPGWDWSILFRDIPASTSATLVFSQMTPPPVSASPTSNISTTSNPTSAATASPSPEAGSSNHTGLIVGVVLAGLVAIALLVIGIWYMRRRQNKWKSQKLIAELEDSSPNGGFKLQNLSHGVQRKAVPVNSSTTVVPEGPPALSAVYPSIAEFYAKQNSPSPKAMSGAVPAAGASIVGATAAVGPSSRDVHLNGNLVHNQHARHYSSGSAGISPVPHSNDSQGRRPSDFLFSPVAAPLTELDAVDSAVKLELPTHKEPELGFMPSPAISSEGDKVGRKAQEKDYDGDGDTSDNSDKPLQSLLRR